MSNSRRKGWTRDIFARSDPPSRILEDGPLIRRPFRPRLRLRRMRRGSRDADGRGGQDRDDGDGESNVPTLRGNLQQ